MTVSHWASPPRCHRRHRALRRSGTASQRFVVRRPHECERCEEGDLGYWGGVDDFGRDQLKGRSSRAA
jgi:hypothetical protein